MINFSYVNATTVDQAVSALGSGKAWVLAGGTELLNLTLKPYAYPDSLMPDTLVNIQNIPGLSDITESGGTMNIGALATLSDIADSSQVKTNFKALAEAAAAVGTPEIRNMGTIAGNIAQSVECWYYRAPFDRFDCLRKNPNGTCYALVGDNRYQSIFGALEGCVAVHPSDTAPALLVFDASVVTSKRTIKISDFFAFNVPFSNVLESDEVIVNIQMPVPTVQTSSAFVKFAIRKSMDFPIVNCAAALVVSGGMVTSAKIALNAVYNLPMRVPAAEQAITGKAINDSNAEAAGEAAVSDATPLPLNEGTGNAWMIQIAKTMVKRAILAAG